MTDLNKRTLWTALVTPFNDDLTVDFKSLENIVNEQVCANNGLLILGSTGEALNISLAAKKQIIEFVLEQKPNVPVMVGVGGHNLGDTKQWIKYLEKLSIDAYLMVTPLYAKPGAQGQYLWFKTLMDEVSKPVVLYNVPGRTGISLSLEAVAKLKDHKNYWAIKEAGGSVESFKSYLSASGNKAIFCGDDGLLTDLVNAGAIGLISVAANVWPKETHLYVTQCLNKSFDAKELWETAANSLFLASNPIPAKAMMSSQKRITNNTMMPPLCDADFTDLTPVEKADRKIKNWYSQQT